MHDISMLTEVVTILGAALAVNLLLARLLRAWW
jgi:hypothetical protein